MPRRRPIEDGGKILTGQLGEGLEDGLFLPDQELQHAADIAGGKLCKNFNLGGVRNLHKDFRNIRRTLNVQLSRHGGRLAALDTLDDALGIKRLG